MTPKLKEAAKTINYLAKQEEDARLKLCRAIASAMDLVKKESNLSWREWAEGNLRKADGSKWSMWTLYSYASFGRDPKKLNHVRKSIAENGKNARRAMADMRRQNVDADYALGGYICNNPWHSDDHLRAKTLARRTTTSVLPLCEGQAEECDGGLHPQSPQETAGS